MSNHRSEVGLLSARIEKSKWYRLIVSIILYIGLPLLILSGIIDFAYKFYALVIGAVCMFAVMRFSGFSNKDMGLTTGDTKKSILHILPITVVLLAIGLFMYFGGYSRITPNENWYFFIFYIFVSSPVQEFLYRGALLAVFESYRMKYVSQMPPKAHQ
jgi:hypothetical protein